MRKEFQINNLNETKEIAKQLASLLSPSDVIALEGDLGAGKTTFTQALAKELGVERNVSSPTFTIIKQYEGDYLINHLDVYRLEGSEEDLGWDEIFYGEAITIVEWAHFIQDFLPEQYLEITIKHQSETGRVMTFVPYGKRYENMCKEIQL